MNPKRCPPSKKSTTSSKHSERKSRRKDNEMKLDLMQQTIESIYQSGEHKSSRTDIETIFYAGAGFMILALDHATESLSPTLSTAFLNELTREVKEYFARPDFDATPKEE